MKRSHWLLMLLCCLIPLVGIAAIVLFRVPAGSVLYVALVLMCPLLHLVMMRSMGHDPSVPTAHEGHHLQGKPAADISARSPRGASPVKER